MNRRLSLGLAALFFFALGTGGFFICTSHPFNCAGGTTQLSFLFYVIGVGCIFGALPEDENENPSGK
jgi:hypothetical protein